MTQELFVGIVQADLAWENPLVNRETLGRMIRQTPHCHLYLLPELFSTAFSPNPDCTENMDGPSIQWMQALACETQAVIAGSLAIEEDGKIYNRFLWVRPDATYEYYDKRHLFCLSREAEIFTHGKEDQKIISEWGWRFCLQICYDLRFPCASQNTFKNETYAYDVLLYCASWPKARAQAWRCLLQARAIENQAYCIGVNRIGVDGNDIPHAGESLVFDAEGNLLVDIASESKCLRVNLQKKKQENIRRKFPVAKDWLKTIIPLFLCLLFFAGCSGTRRLQQGQQLLVKNKIKIEGSAPNVSSSNLLGLTVQDPNEAFLGMRIRLSIYNMARDSSHKKTNSKWNNKLREIGEPPIILDTQAVLKTEKLMQSYMASKGFFEPDISYKITKRGIFNRKGKAKVTYYVKPNDPYRYREVEREIRDDSLIRFFKQWLSRSLIKPGAIYDVEVLEKERARITNRLQNMGYFGFTKEYITYMIDSSLGTHQMDIMMVLKGVRSSHRDSSGQFEYFPHKQYFIKEVEYVYQSNKQPNLGDSVIVQKIQTLNKKELEEGKTEPPYFIHYQDKLDLSPKVLIQKTFIDPGDLFSLTNTEYSYLNLSDLRLFSYTNINYLEMPYDTNKTYLENNQLLCRINIKEMPKYNISTQGEINTSGGVQGIAANVSLVNKNIFKRGAILSLRIGGAFDFQAALSKKNKPALINTIEGKAELSIEIPRFLSPVSVERFSKYFRPKTRITLGYNYQYRKDYQRMIGSLNMTYLWKEGKHGHALTPVELNLVKIFGSPSFTKYVDSVGQINKRIRYQYQDHFILNAHYSYVYNGEDSRRKTGFNFVRFNLELAGNLLELGYMAAKATKNENNQHLIFGIPFAQYAKADVDYKHHFIFKEKTALVLRAFVGLGFPYGNSYAMPYEKAYYGGGSNNMRAWRLYQLGPGSYASENKQIEQLGDIILVLNAEQRFPIVGGFGGAVFVDAGNIWLTREDPQMPGAKFKFSEFYKEIAVGAGIGFRYDFGFFLIRLDIALPICDPSKPEKHRFVLPKTQWSDLMFNFGIGYPF